MKITHLSLAPLAAALLLMTAGCQRGSVEVEELRADNARLSAELDKAYAEIDLLRRQRDAAREENVRLREQLAGMEQQIRSFGAGTQGIDPDIFGVDERSGALIVKDVAFNPGSNQLNDQALQALRGLARELTSGDYTGTLVIVEGHTDSTPVSREDTVRQFGDNWGLSAMRATAVVRALTEAGVAADRLRGSFRGQYQPRATNNTAEGKAANRRVEIFLALPPAAAAP